MSLLVSLFLLTAAAWAEAPSTPTDDQLRSPPESTGGLQWVRLTSGEWVNGELKGMRTTSLRFDSDQFGIVEIDWDDIDALYIPTDTRWGGPAKLRYQGPAVLVDGVLTVTDDKTGVQTLPKDDVFNIVSGGDKEIQNWSFMLRTGFTGRWGNAPQTTLSVGSNLTREDTVTRWATAYDGNWGTTNKVATTNNHRGTTQFDIFMTPYFYLTPAGGELYSDSFQNIGLRATGYVGVGARWVRKVFELGGGVSGVVLNTQLSSVQAGDPLNQTNGGMRLDAYNYWDVTDDIDFDITWTSTIVFTDLASTYHHGKASWVQEITGALDWDLSVVYDRIEDPPPLEDGTIVKSDDVQLIVGLRIEL